MKKEPKNEAVVRMERAEAARLAEAILEMTARIPAHVINTPGVMYARRFKEQMATARKLASAPRKDLLKLRTAMQEVNFYYVQKVQA